VNECVFMCMWGWGGGGGCFMDVIIHVRVLCGCSIQPSFFPLVDNCVSCALWGK